MVRQHNPRQEASLGLRSVWIGSSAWKRNRQVAGDVAQKLGIAGQGCSAGWRRIKSSSNEDIAAGGTERGQLNDSMEQRLVGEGGRRGRVGAEVV